MTKAHSRSSLAWMAATLLATACGPAATRTPPERPGDRPAGAGRFDAAIETLARRLERDYVMPEVGARYAAALRASLARGAYRGETEPRDMGARLTAELRAVAFDGHLRVVPEGEDRPPPGSPRGERLPPVDGERWLADGVAYLALHELPDDPGSVARVDRFLRDHADARALVLDLRTCRGGGPPIMNVLLPYLFARRTSLVYFEMSARIAEQLGPPPDEGPSFPTVPAPPGLVRRAHVAIPHPSEHRLFDAAVYLLVSRRTASAGEHLALALKRTRRAVLVGERTAGANHFGGMEPIGAGLAVFLPVGRTIDPDTGRDWERVGIQPDLAVPPDQALEAALMHMRRSAR